MVDSPTPSGKQSSSMSGHHSSANNCLDHKAPKSKKSLPSASPSIEPSSDSISLNHGQSSTTSPPLPQPKRKPPTLLPCDKQSLSTSGHNSSNYLEHKPSKKTSSKKSLPSASPSSDNVSLDHGQSSATSPPLPTQPKRKSPSSLSAIESMSSPILVSSSPSKPTQYWIKELHLFPCDKHVLSSSVQWLNDNVINAAQQLLLDIDGNSKVGGFQHTQLKLKPIELEQSFIQILHVDSKHWITVSNIRCQSNEVIVYDSRYTGLSLKTKLNVSALMQQHSITKLKFLIANLQQQNDSCSCGLFAIATATELAVGGDPITCQWHKPQMRSHLLQCFETKQMTPFPRNDRGRRARKQRYILTIEEDIYCTCRQVNDTKRGMVICSICNAWFHLDCMGLTEQLVPDNWKCPKH